MCKELLSCLEMRTFKIEELEKFFNRYSVLTYHLFKKKKKKKLN